MMSDYDKLFISAIENRDIQTLKLIPKADLHNHFSSVEIENILISV